MALITTKYVRKPLYVDAIQVTTENFVEISLWSKGTIRDKELETVSDRPVDPRRDHIFLPQAHNPKNDRQSKAYVGDWVLKTDKGFKIYTKRAFENAFDIVVPEPTKRLAHPSDTAAKMQEPNIHKEDLVGIDGLSNIQGDGPSSDPKPEQFTDGTLPSDPSGDTWRKSLEQAGAQAEAEQEAAKPAELQEGGPEVPGDQPTEGSWAGGES